MELSSIRAAIACGKQSDRQGTLLAAARTALVRGARQVIANALAILGVGAPQAM